MTKEIYISLEKRQKIIDNKMNHNSIIMEY